MPRPWRIRFAGAKYHVTVRGNAREVIFHAPEDYERFLEQLQSALALDGGVRVRSSIIKVREVRVLFGHVGA